MKPNIQSWLSSANAPSNLQNPKRSPTFLEKLGILEYLAIRELNKHPCIHRQIKTLGSLYCQPCPMKQPSNQKTLAIATLIVATGILIATHGLRFINQMRIEKLLQTKTCPGCNLQYSDLTGTNLSGANLQGANLEGANLERANLEGADLSQTNLKQANLNQVKLKDANLDNANLESATLQSADLGCATVEFGMNAGENGANLHVNVNSHKNSSQNSTLNFNLNANANGATMQFTAFGCTNLESANLKSTRLPDGTVHP